MMYGLIIYLGISFGFPTLVYYLYCRSEDRAAQKYLEHKERMEKIQQGKP